MAPRRTRRTLPLRNMHLGTHLARPQQCATARPEQSRPRSRRRENSPHRLLASGGTVKVQQDEAVVVFDADGTHTERHTGWQISLCMSSNPPSPEGTRQAMVTVYDEQGKQTEVHIYAAVWYMTK